MKIYGSLEKIAAAQPGDMAKKCGISVVAASTVKAAARLALEDKDTKIKTFSAKKYTAADNAASLADEAFAADQQPAYSEEPYDNNDN
jgi:hypothetical protein